MKDGILQRIGASTVVTLIIVALGVGATTVAFRTHTADFEDSFKVQLSKHEKRISEIESRERDNYRLFGRLEAQMNHISKDMGIVKTTVATILQRLPNKGQ